jgi:hypothetical protein
MTDALRPEDLREGEMGLLPCPVDLETYAIALIVEEANEAGQMVGKWLRFGPDHARRDGLTARKGLSLELGDMLAAIDYGLAAGIVIPDVLAEQRKRKFAKLTDPTSLDDEGRRLAPVLTRPSPAPDKTAPVGEGIDLLTKAVGDIAAALTMAGAEAKINGWTAPYVAAINRADATPPAPEAETVASPAGESEEGVRFRRVLSSARGHLANVRAHGNAEANAAVVIAAALDAAEAALASPARNMVASEDQVEAAWTELKRICCSDASKAKRCIMVERHQFAAAIAAQQQSEHGEREDG